MAESLRAAGGTISVQSLNEFVSIVRRKLGMNWEEMRERSALDCRALPYHIYDSLILAAALEAGSNTLYSEDMKSGQTIEGLTITTPFRS
jgi:predicted nucleic acid-binding protein